MGSLEDYLNILNSIIEDGITLETLVENLNIDNNKLLVYLYELKSLGWVELRNTNYWLLTEAGSIAKKLFSPSKQLRDVELTKDNINILVTFPRAFGDISQYFPNFIDTANIFKNEMSHLENGDELLILSYSVDFNILSEILEDTNIVKSGKERGISCSIQYFHGYNESAISTLSKSGFNVSVNKLLISGPGQPHAKVMIFKKRDGKSMIISSANFTDNVFRTRNLEIGIFTKDETLIDEMVRFYNWLWRKTSLD